MSRLSVKEQVQRVREDAIVDAVNRLLAAKGYDLMTVDEVAAEAGIAKASLYKHFTSKEELACAAMVRVLDRAIAHVDELRAGPERPAIEQLKAVARWTLRVQLAGEMPSLPSQNGKLTSTLKASAAYMDRLIDLSNKLGAWITEAQTSGQLNAAFPPELVLYTLFARACDPVLPLMQASKQHDDEAIVEWLVATTFDGLRPPAAAAVKRR